MTKQANNAAKRSSAHACRTPRCAYLHAKEMLGAFKKEDTASDDPSHVCLPLLPWFSCDMDKVLVNSLTWNCLGISLRVVEAQIALVLLTSLYNQSGLVVLVLLSDSFGENPSWPKNFLVRTARHDIIQLRL